MQNDEFDFSFKKLFVPLTTLKAIHWIVIIGLIIYFNSLFGSFISDDSYQIVNNNVIQSWSGIFGSFTGAPTNSGGQLVGVYYRPLMSVFYTILYCIFGATPFIFHLFQVFIHITNSLLLYIILKKIFKNVTAFIIALIFLIHPLNVESVAYISTLQTVLYMFFGLASLLLIMDKKKYWVIYIFLLCSLLSRETGILFVFIDLLYIFMFRKKTLLKNIIYVSIIVLIYLFLRIGIAHIGFRTTPITPSVVAPFETRIMNIPAVSTYYLNNFIFPRDLLSEQAWVITKPDFANVYLPFFELLLFSGFLVYSIIWINKKHKDQLKLLTFFILWFVSGMLLIIQLYPLDMSVADRYFYFPIVGLLGIIALLLSNIKINHNLKTLTSVILVSIIIIFSLRTIIRNNDWKNELTLYGHDIKYAKEDDFQMNSAYGTALLATGKYDKAFYYLNKANQIYPGNWINWCALGLVNYDKGDMQKAKEAFSQSINTGHFYQAYEDMAKLLLKQRDYYNASKLVDDAKRYYPYSEELLDIQLYAKYKSGDHNGAVATAQELYSIFPTQQNYSFYTILQQNQPLPITGI